MSETIRVAKVFCSVGILDAGNCQRVVHGGRRASSECPWELNTAATQRLFAIVCILFHTPIKRITYDVSF